MIGYVYYDHLINPIYYEIKKEDFGIVLSFSQNEAETIFKKVHATQEYLEEFDIERIRIKGIPHSDGNLNHDYYQMSECYFILLFYIKKRIFYR